MDNEYNRGYVAPARPKKHYSKLLWLAVAVFVIVLGQILYPSRNALPQARINGNYVGGQGTKEIAQFISQKYRTAKLTVDVRGEANRTVKASVDSAGLVPDAETAAKQVAKYPWWQRIIPLSLLYKLFSNNVNVGVVPDKDRLSEFEKSVLKICNVSPVNASITITGGRAELKAAKNGQSCEPKLVHSRLLETKIEADGAKVKVSSRVDKPKRGDNDVKKLLSSAQEILDRKLSIIVGDKKYTPGAEQISKWMIFPEEEKTKKLSVSLSPEAMKPYLEGLQKTYYIPPGTTTIELLDGQETARTLGSSGKGIDISKTAIALKEKLENNGGELTAMTAILPPKVVYKRSYSPTQAGLQALVRYLAERGDVAISVRTLKGVSASANGSKQYVAASTYKLFVAYTVLKSVESGGLKWSDVAIQGRTVDQCFEAMIVNSDNTCAEWFGDKVVWQKVTNDMRTLGLGSTGLRPPRTTADDLNLFLQKLEQSQSLQGASRDRLLSAMRRQVYRAGVPSGVTAAVADKVGFLDGYLHDAAIVYSPNRTYTLAVLTRGLSWSDIADISRQIDVQLSRM